MSFWDRLGAFLTDPAQWSGPSSIPTRVLEHIEVSALAVVMAVIVAVPAGVVLGHLRRGSVFAVAVVNIGRALPSFAVVALALPICLRLGLGLGFWPTFVALFVLALPPIFTNALTGVREVDPQVVEAARAMGLSGPRVVTHVELPLAAPVILAATRVSAVQVVATAPLGALVAYGGLGRLIIDGIFQRDFEEALVGAALVALLAVATELAFGLAERLLLPRGVARLTRTEAAALVGRAA